jgi:alpha-glucoside transport system substrate-binding protein
MKRWLDITSFVVVLAMLLVACSPAAIPNLADATAGPGLSSTALAVATAGPAPVGTAAEVSSVPTQSTAAAGQPTETAESAQVTSVPGAPVDYSKVGPELAKAFAGKYKGKTVTISGPFIDQDEVNFNNSIKDFTSKTGIKIKYSGSTQFETSIYSAIEGGKAPDIVDFPQPGLLENFAAEGKVIDLSKIINANWLKQNYKQSWLDMADMPGSKGSITAGVWSRVTGEDLIWYPKAAFDAAGYKVPTTWDDLMKLSDQIVSNGSTPWCIGVESGAATGWPATDWIEMLMLRTGPLSNYDNWVNGNLKFDSPEVKRAISYMTPIWFNDKYVYGGAKSIATTNFADAPKPMFDNPPKCWLLKQGNFITGFFPQNANYDVFYAPPVDPQYGKPFEVVGDIYAMFKDRPETRAVIQYFSMGESVKTWVQAGGILSPHNDSSLDWYNDPVTKHVAQIMADATSIRFDASDQMPGVVGTGTFWKEMTSWVSGVEDEETALKNIDASWPTK